MNTENRSLPNLVVPREDAREKIQERIDKGQQLRDLPIHSEAELEDAWAEYSNWSSYNSRLLSTLFDSSSIARLHYNALMGDVVPSSVLATEIGRYRKNVTEKINRLKGLLEELELIPEPISNSTAISSPAQTVANGNTENQSLPNLVVPREEAREKIQARIDKGQQLRDLPIRSEAELEDAWAKYSTWSSYNSNLLSTLFDSSLIASLHCDFLMDAVVSRNPVLATEIGRYRKNVTEKINRLKGLLEELELIPEPISNSTAISSQEQTDARGNGVFIVHGHDTDAKGKVASVVKELGLEPTILDEKPGGGRTIIEKFEEYASKVGYAIVLLTPDDVGEAKDKQDNLNPRARQNVIFEMGYFVKGLGRRRVCAMSTEEVEIPSDLAGVEYIRLDSKDEWEDKLVLEMKAAGLPVE